jgi:chemotaxis protein CheX
MSGPEPLPLPAVMDLKAAAPLRAALLDRRGGALELDGSEVERIGGLCLQVLLAAETTWRADGHAFAVIRPSPALEEGLRLLGAPDLASPAKDALQ